MDSNITKLIESEILVCGRIHKENGIVRFERVNYIQLDNIPESERAYATKSIGRAIFTIDEEGKIHNFKGVDSHLDKSELGTKDLVDAKSIEFSQGDGKYKVSAIVFSGKQPEIRINGASPLEDIEIEADINIKMAQMGVKVPRIKYIKEFSQDFSKRYGLPLKIPGNLNSFESDYAVEDENRKARLQEVYENNYVQELNDNERPESMREYLQRIGFISSLDIQENIKSLGYSIQEFCDAVDKSYSRGQRYGQAERILESPFRISDLEIYISKGDTEKLQEILNFSGRQNPEYEIQLADCFGKNIAILMSNGWECENVVHRQDFSLGGEFCDDSYFDIFEKIMNTKEKYSSKPYKAEAMINEIKRKYVAQVMHVASTIKIIQETMLRTGKSEKQANKVLEQFVESFTNNLDLSKSASKFKQTFGIEDSLLMQAITSKFAPGQNWIVQLAGINRAEGLIMDGAVYNAHFKNEEFYNKVSNMIYERMRILETEKGKSGFEDCIEDDKTRSSEVQEATQLIKNTKIDKEVKNIKKMNIT